MSPAYSGFAALLLGSLLAGCGHYGPPSRTPAQTQSAPASAIQSASPAVEPCEDPEKKAEAHAPSEETRETGPQ